MDGEQCPCEQGKLFCLQSTSTASSACQPRDSLGLCHCMYTVACIFLHATGAGFIPRVWCSL